MKCMLISDDSEPKRLLIEHLQTNGYECITYLEPLKAMDNLEEIAPDVVLFNIRDYPRHWKPFLHYLRQWRDSTATLFILMSDQELNYEEAKKAEDLQVNGIIDWNTPELLGQLQQIVIQKRRIHAIRTEERLKPYPDDQIAFLFTHPDTLYLISGEIVNISPNGICLRPDDTATLEGLIVGNWLGICALRLERELCPLECTLVYLKGEYLGVSIQKMDAPARQWLARYIDDLSLRRSEQGATLGYAEQPR